MKPGGWMDKVWYALVFVLLSFLLYRDVNDHQMASAAVTAAALVWVATSKARP